MKYILLTILLGFVIIACYTPADLETAKKSVLSPEKESALIVLNLRCNSCHRKQNPWKMFSEENMDRFAPKIYTQVFELERMPKGKDNNLSIEEKSALMSWLNTQLNQE